MTPNVISVVVLYDLKRINLPGQQVGLHSIWSSSGPRCWSKQFRPPFIGSGLVHERLRCFMPPPQVFEHAPHDVHWVYPPLMAAGVEKCYVFIRQ